LYRISLEEEEKGIARIPIEEDFKPFREGNRFVPTTPFPPGISGQAIVHHALTIEEEGPTHLTRLMCLGGWPMFQSQWTLTEHAPRLNKDVEVSEASEETLGPTPPK
jgi:hypothetical protein